MNRTHRKRATTKWTETISRNKIERQVDTSFDPVTDLQNSIDSQNNGRYKQPHGYGVEYSYESCQPLGALGTPQFTPLEIIDSTSSPTKSPKETTPAQCSHCSEGGPGSGNARNYNTNNWVNAGVQNSTETADVRWRYETWWRVNPAHATAAANMGLNNTFKERNLETVVGYPIKKKDTTQTRTYNAWSSCLSFCYPS